MIRRFATVAADLLVVAVTALLAAVAIVPRVAGGAALTVLTGSMEPAISPGDMVVVRPVEPSKLRIGDVVTFMPRPNDPTLVTHRVVAEAFGAEQMWITRGDANNTDDPPIVAAQIVGRHWYTLPAVGWLVNWLERNRIPVMAGVAAAAVVWLLWGLRKPKKHAPADEPEGDTPGTPIEAGLANCPPRPLT